MPGENPGAYDEARKRIRETTENENIIIEKKKEDFEKGKEKIYSKKKLDVFELKRRIETGQSLNILKNDIRNALESGEISVDTYNNALSMIDDAGEDLPYKKIIPEYTLAPDAFPFSDAPLTKYFESKKIGENPLVDIAGFAYGFTQGSVFLLFLMGRIVLDFLLLPRDIYSLLRKNP